MNAVSGKFADSSSSESLLTLKNRGLLSLTGVDDVITFDDKAVEVITADGVLAIEGDGIKIEKLDIGKKELSLSGRISALIYSDKQPKKVRGLFGKEKTKG